MSQVGGRGAGREGGPGCRAAGWGAVRVGVRVALCSAATSELRFSVKWTGPAWGLPRGAPSPGGRRPGRGEAWGQLRILAVSAWKEALLPSTPHRKTVCIC